MKTRNPAPAAVPECTTLRLAQGEVATLDMCSCGTLRLNLGAITVRLTPEALSSLMQTVSEGLATHSALRRPTRFTVDSAGCASAAAKDRGPLMSDRLIDVRTPLAVSQNVRVELGRDGGLHVVTAMLTLHLPRAQCEELTTTLARALVRLHKLNAPRKRPSLRVVGDDDAEAALCPDHSAAPESMPVRIP